MLLLLYLLLVLLILPVIIILTDKVLLGYHISCLWPSSQVVVASSYLKGSRLPREEAVGK